MTASTIGLRQDVRPAPVGLGTAGLVDEPPVPATDQRAAFRQDLESYGPHAFLRERSVYAVALYRLGRWNDQRSGAARGRRALSRLYWPAYRAVEAVTGISLPKEAAFGPGLRIHHAGPVVVHPEVVVGANCVLRHGVTLGERAGKGAPVLGDDVELGAYAQVLGPVQVGTGAKIGALALVLHDVPADGVAYAPVATIVAPRGERLTDR